MAQAAMAGSGASLPSATAKPVATAVASSETSVAAAMPASATAVADISRSDNTYAACAPAQTRLWSEVALAQHSKPQPHDGETEKGEQEIQEDDAARCVVILAYH